MIVSNELYDQWKALIYKIAKKYINNPYNLELEDLVQIGSIGFIEGIRSFDDSKGVPLMNFLYTCISNAILKEFRRFNCDKRKANWNTTSINTPIKDTEDTTLEDMIEDTFINISDEVENKIMNKFFEDMFYKYLNNEKAYILTSKIINQKSSKDLSIELNYSPDVIDRIYRSSLQTLYNKCGYIKNKYIEHMRRKELQSMHFDSKVEREALKFVLWRG